MLSVAFYMWEPLRRNRIAEHLFYVEQARERLLSQFENIGDEATAAAEKLLSEAYFDPDVHDPTDFYEAANDKSIELYELLSDLRDRTRLAVISGMYHEWDKQLRVWMARELRNWANGPAVRQALWSANLTDLLDLLIAFDWNGKALPCFDQLDTMRLVVNVFKHGEGASLNELKSRKAEFFPTYLGSDSRSWHVMDHTQMVVKDRHVDEFSEAIVGFWEAIPERIFAKDEIDAPKWFEKAFLKDQAA